MSPRLTNAAMWLGMVAMMGTVACTPSQGESTETGPEPDAGLFTCPFTASCDRLLLHIEPDPYEAVECAAQLIVSEQPGLLMGFEWLGGSLDETESIVVLPGDGTVIVQERHRECYECDSETLPWEDVTTEICEIDGFEMLSTACADEDSSDCRWNHWGVRAPGVVNCQPAEQEYSCDDIDALLAGS